MLFRSSVALPSWAAVAPGATYADTGLCVNGPLPTGLSVNGGAVPTPTPTPTPTTTPTPTPTATGTGLVATLTTDSTWAAGSCRTLVVSNPTSKSVSTWQAWFTLPAGARITSSWSGTVTTSGQQVNVQAPSWGGTIPAGGSVKHFGFCMDTPADPTGLRAA